MLLFGMVPTAGEVLADIIMVVSGMTGAGMLVWKKNVRVWIAAMTG